MMKSIFMFAYSLVAYLVGFASLVFWILSLSQLVPAVSIDRSPQVGFVPALLTNVLLVLLFALPHSAMARPWFKEWFTRFVPRPIERSTYVLVAGLLLFLLVWRWEPMGGTVWSISEGSVLYYVMYALFFLGWVILLISTFLINHFDLFGLRQTYLELTGKAYGALEFKVVAFYKYVRHPLYFGILLGIWSTPVMTLTHLVFAILLTAYTIIGALFEEKDLEREFGESYRSYQKRTPMLIPFFKKSNR
jgi:protein-S-isoprenylcysteine O-methyltransferase Ste14